LPADQGKRLQAAARPSLKEWLMAESAGAEWVLPPRGLQHHLRVVMRNVGDFANFCVRWVNPFETVIR